MSSDMPGGTGLDLAKVNIKAELQPLTFTVWREQVRGDGIPLTAAFFAPDYFGSAQYVQYFGMAHGAPWAKRAGAEKVPDLYNKAEEEAAAKALASGGDAMTAPVRRSRTDLAVCADLAMATARCATYNVRANLPDAQAPHHARRGG